MWKGWIINESLKDERILSNFRIVKSVIEENNEGTEKEVWTLSTVEFEDKEVEKISKMLEESIKLEYYAHFTNGKELLIVFAKKSFKIKLKSMGIENPYGISEFKLKESDKKIWKLAFEYGTKKAKVDPRYFIKVE
ncbi:MAG: hypothetical protein ACOYT4_00780 [Nanoarchaeota archaeon]